MTSSFDPSSILGDTPVPGATSALFELWTGSLTGRDIAVVSFHGRESISRPFSFDVFVHTPAQADLLDTPLLGQPATMIIQRAGALARVVQGVVEAIEPHGASSTVERTAYRIRIVPALRLLKWQTTSRIFQKLTVPDIVATVLRQAAVPVTASWKLSRDYPVRDYCLQHQENDLAFVERLLAEEGIFYYFEHPSADDLAGASHSSLAETVVFADSIEGYPPIEGEGPGSSPALTLRPTESMRASLDDDVQNFSLKRSVRSNATLLRDYDFRRPLLDQRAEGTMAVADPAAGPAGLRVYVHRGEYAEPEVTPARARTALDQHRRQAADGTGESTCRRLLPGHRFTLLADRPTALAGEYVLTQVEHQGHAPEYSAQGTRPYQARFRCAPASAPYRPKRPKARLRQVLESAVVVGPAGEDVYTDAYGRIKVQFHWDLSGARNEHSSCWIRVVQAWAGAGWGFQFIPRVGMEVMVTFLGGDQDCPVVTGCVSNATHPVPYLLPEHKTKSGIRTQTVPGGVGFNELLFEDRKGGEEVILRAQRNLTEAILNDRTVTVQHDDRLRVSGLMTSTVDGPRVQNTGGTFAENIAGEHRRTTAGDCQFTTQKSRTDKIGGDRAATVSGGETVTIGGSAVTKIGKSHMLDVSGRQTTRIGSKDDDGATLSIKGDYRIDATGGIEIRADKGFSLRCGSTTLDVTPDVIKLMAKSLILAGTSSASISGNGPAIQLDDRLSLSAKHVKLAAQEDFEVTADKRIRLITAKSSLGLDENAKLKGKQVLLNCNGDDSVDDPPAPPPKDKARTDKTVLRVIAKDANAKPYARKKYTLAVDGAKIAEGETGDDGLIEREVAPTAQKAEIKLVLDGGRTLVMPLTIGQFAPVDQVRGVKGRLKNLGYYHGDVDDAADAETARAIRGFQNDNGLDVTGSLDKATKVKLKGLCGS